MARRNNEEHELKREFNRQSVEYECLIKEQKDRILSLRDENRELREQLEEFKRKADSISSAIVNAELTAAGIINASKKQAMDILREADARIAAKEQAIDDLNAMLADMLSRMELISRAARSELERNGTQRRARHANSPESMALEA